MAFNNWPYTNFQDLNLGWILATYKSALNKALEALGKANEVEAEVDTYSDQISAATLTANQASATANQAMNIARHADDVLFVYSDSENKAVDYKQYTDGVTAYITAPDIFSAVTADHKVPIFMDSNMYFYDMAGYETNPEQPLMVTRVKFVRDSTNRQDIVWIDRNGSITYTHIDGSGNGFPVVFNYIPQNPELPASGYWDSDKTYAEILAAINSGMSIFLTVKIDGETRELINNAYISKSSSSTYIALGYSKGFDISDSPYYTNTENLLVYYTINSNEFVSVQRVFTVPPSSTQLTGRVLTVNSYGKAEWMTASGGGGGDGLFVIPVTSATAGGVTTYSTTATFAEIMSHMPNLIVHYTNTNLYYPLSYTATSDPNSWYQFVFSAQEPNNGELDTEWLYVVCANNAATVTAASLDIKGLPAVSSADNGKFLRVVSGAWAADTVPSAESTSFGP